MKQEDRIIDILKLLFSICIVWVHSGLFPRNVQSLGDYGWILNMIVRQSIPFFFVCSGYYLEKQLEKSKEISIVFKEYRKNLFPSYVFWFLLYTCIYSAINIISGQSIISAIIKIIQSAIFYPLGAMWFVWALIIASYIIEFVYKKKCGLLLASILGIIGYVFALICNNYYFVVISTPINSIVSLYMKVCESPRNGLLVALIFMLLGIGSRKIVKDAKIRKSVIRVLLVISVIICSVEAILIYGKPTLDDKSLYISYLLLVPVIVLFAVTHDVKIKLPYKAMRELSKVLYYPHSVILLFLGHIVHSKSIIFVLAIIILCIMYYLYKKNNLRRYKWLLP